jgi:hypothetical protein
MLFPFWETVLPLMALSELCIMLQDEMVQNKKKENKIKAME